MIRFEAVRQQPSGVARKLRLEEKHGAVSKVSAPAARAQSEIAPTG
jgi:hypothetical protein